MIFTIPGEPKAKQRPRMMKTGHTYTPQATVNYENWVKQCYTLSEEKERLEGQIEAHIIAFFSIPKSASKTKREQMLSGYIRPTKKPDTDNIGKIVLDSLNKLAFDDDSQVVTLTVDKFYANEPKVVVELIGQEVIAALKGEKKTGKKKS